MKNMVYSLWFIVYGIFWLSTACFAGQDAWLSQEEKVQKAKEYYASGKNLLAQGDYRAADEQFRKAQEFLTQGSSISQDTAVSSSRANKAIPVKTAGIPARQASPPAAPGDNRQAGASSLAQKAWKAAERGASEEAVSLYREAINALAPDANLYYNLALEYLKTKRFKEAAQTLKRVIQIHSRDKDAYFNLGVLYESYLNDKKQALDYYAQYLKFAPAHDDTAEVKEWVRQIKKELKAR